VSLSRACWCHAAIRGPVTTVLVLSTSLILLNCTTGGEPGAVRPAAVRVGLVRSLFRDVPVPLVQAALRPFGALMHEQTGLQGELLDIADADALGEQLAGDQLQLGVFHGYEFAWALQKHADLVPLMIAVNQEPRVDIHLIVKQDCPVSDFAGLKDRVVTVPRGGRAECHLVLERAALARGAEPAKFFGRVVIAPTGEDALDDVADGMAQAAVVDGLCLKCYERRKPGRAARLKELQAPQTFPAPVVAYHAGALNEATLRRFREGMMAAGRQARGKQFLSLWKLTGFEKVPDDYKQLLARTFIAYPPPSPVAAAAVPMGGQKAGIGH
jgi:ABC-type phosphate/phosphonate transport system substrate-binding protein